MGLHRLAGENALSSVDGAMIRRNGTDLTSFVQSDYLGFDHAPRPGGLLALSLPRSVGVHASTLLLESGLARLVGAEAALAEPSSLHALMDVMEVFARGGNIFVDHLSYSLSMAAVDRVATQVRSIATMDVADVAALDEALAAVKPPRVVVTDSFTLPNRLLPIAAIVETCCRHGAWLVLDDTQGMGLLGRGPGRATPYGHGGGGALAHAGAVPWSKTLVVASLAKGLGVPLAFVAGAERAVHRLRREGTSMYSSSQPDLCSVQFALTALEANQSEGEIRRALLADAVTLIRAEAATEGLGLFPVQSWYYSSLRLARRAHDALGQRGVWALLYPDARERHGWSAIRFFVTARHQGPVLTRALAGIRATREEFPP